MKLLRYFLVYLFEDITELKFEPLLVIYFDLALLIFSKSIALLRKLQLYDPYGSLSWFVNNRQLIVKNLYSKISYRHSDILYF